MRSFLQSIVIVLIFISSSSLKSYASHAVGVDLHYQCLGGNQYQFFVEIYRDCGGVNLPNNININLSSASCNININTALARLNIQEVSQICVTQIPNTTCNGGGLPGIEQHTYSGTFTLPAQCSDWVVSYSICCRNASITNLQNAVASNLYTEATLDNTNGLCNSSPVFNSLPTPYLCVNQPFSYNNGAVDPDGNTLVYTLINPLSGSGVNIPYNAGYNAANPMAVSGAFNFNTATGQMTFTPNQIQQGVITVLVQEYDVGNNLVGSTMRDIQIIVIGCTNTPPTVSGVNGSSTNFEFDVCAGNSFCFDIESDDLDLNGTTMSWNQGIPGATFTTAGSPLQTGTFCWTPTVNDVGTHFFTVIVDDNACPIPGINTYIYQIDVIPTTDPPVDAGPDQDICQGETTTLSATVGTGGVITWSPAAGLSCTSCLTPTVTTTTNQIFTATVLYPSGCSQTDQVAININPKPIFTTTIVDDQCNLSSGSITVDVTSTPHGNFLYSIDNGVNFQMSNIFNNLASANYDIVVIDDLLCPNTNTIVVNNIGILTITDTTLTHPLCYSFTDGEIDVTANTTNTSLTYQIDGNVPQASNIFSNLGEGVYEIVVADDNSCADTLTVTLSQPDSIIFDSVTIPSLCYGGCDGEINLSNVTGGNNTYSFSIDNGVSFQNSSNFSGVCSGSHNVITEDGNGCQSTMLVTVNQPTALDLALTINNTSCNNINDGSVTATVTGGMPTYSYNWNGLALNNQFQATNVPAGNYDLTITDDHGCIIDTLNYTVDGPTNPLITNAGMPDTICGSDYLMQAIPTATSTSGDWLNLLTSGPTTATFTSLTDPNSNVNVGTGYGAYTFYWTESDLAGCLDTAHAEIVFIQPPSVDANIDDTVCNSFDYTFNAISILVNNEWSLISGPGNVWYSDINSLTSDITVDAAGEYSFEIVSLNAFNCEARDTINIFFSSPSVTTIIVDDQCNISIGNIVVDVVNNSYGNILYSNDNGVNYQVSNTFSNLASTNYDIVVIDDLLCTDTTTVTVNNIGMLTITDTTLTHPLCYSSTDGEINITATTTTSLTYQIDGNVPQASNIFSNLGEGVYEIVVVDDNLCAEILTVTLFQPDSIIFDSVTIPALCYGGCDGEINLSNVTGGNNTYNYSMDNGVSFQNSGNFSGVCSGSHNVIAEDGNGCQSTMLVTVNQPTELDLTITIDSTSCYNTNDGMVTATVTGGTPTYSYNWNGLALNNQFQATNVPSGNYDLTITDDHGCIIDTLNYEVGEPNIVNTGTIVTTPTLCFGNQNGTIEVIGATGIGILNYSIDGVNFQTANIFNGLTSGTYTVHVLDVNGCKNTTTAIVNSPSLVTADAQSTTTSLCIGEQFTLQGVGAGGTGVLSYSWNNGVGIGQNHTIIASASNSYEVTITDENGCNETDFIHVEVLQAIDVTAFSDIMICLGQTASIAAFANGGDGNGNLLNYNFIWDNGVTGINQDVSPLVTTTYAVYATDGCTSPSDSAYVTITVNNPPIVDFSLSNNNGCKPIAVDFIDNSPTPGVTCLWNFGDGFVSTDCGSTSHDYANPGLYNISYSITDINGCSTILTYTDSVEVYDIPLADFSFSPEIGSLINNEITFTNESFGADAYIWSFGDSTNTNISNQENPVIQYPNSYGGIYNTCLIALNDEGCRDTTCKQLEILDEFFLYVPNTFTPNSDGVNDFFGPTLLGADPNGYEFLIFNRWGQLIFQSNSLDNTWDGTYQGYNSPIDTYVWTIKMDKTVESTFETRTGHINLIR